MQRLLVVLGTPVFVSTSSTRPVGIDPTWTLLPFPPSRAWRACCGGSTSPWGPHDPVDLGGAELTDGDGLLLMGKRTLLVVHKRSNQIAVVKLDSRYRSGRMVRTTTHPDFDVPTTVARQRGSLYLPNARLTTPPAPDADYWVTRVR